MNALLRLLLVAALAAWVALPSPGNEGGENAGSTGVWVLPRATFLCSNAGTALPEVPRLEIALPDLTKSVHLRLSDEMGVAVASLIDGVSGLALGLTVLNDKVVLPASLLQSLAATGVTDSDVLVVDAGQLGYRIDLRIDPVASTATIRVF